MSTMKHPRLAIATALVLGCGAAAADSGPPECSLETLAGTYVFTASGFGAPAGAWAPKAIVEVIRFNGDSSLSVLSATVANARGDGAVASVRPGPAGTYALEADCTGWLTFANSPTRFAIVASIKGDDVAMIQTDPINNVFQGRAVRWAR